VAGACESTVFTRIRFRDSIQSFVLYSFYIRAKRFPGLRAEAFTAWRKQNPASVQKLYKPRIGGQGAANDTCDDRKRAFFLIFKNKMLCAQEFILREVGLLLALWKAISSAPVRRPDRLSTEE
jgi:hypothetical protein